jgi:gamma-glutamyl phosphate reductase
MLDRLALTPARLKGIADDVRQVCNLADPVGQVIDGGLLDSGLRSVAACRSASSALFMKPVQT